LTPFGPSPPVLTAAAITVGQVRIPAGLPAVAARLAEVAPGSRVLKWIKTIYRAAPGLRRPGNGTRAPGFDRPSSTPRERMPLHSGLLGGERSVCLIECDMLADVKPPFKNDTDIVPIPPR
jgi:hypothetical protein